MRGAPEAIGHDKQFTQAVVADHTCALCFRVLENGFLVDAHHLSVAHHDLAIDEHGCDVGSVGEVGQSGDRQVDGYEMGFEQIDQDNVGALAGFNRSELVASTQALVPASPTAFA